MNQICITNIKLEGKPMTIPQLIRYFDDQAIYRKLRTNMLRREIYHREHRVTWELHEKEIYWLANGQRFDNKQKMAKMLNVNYHSLKSRKEKEWVFAGIVFQKIENSKLYTQEDRHPDKPILTRERALVEVTPTYDEIDFKGIKLVRKFIGDNLAKTYAYDCGQKYLQA